MELQAKTTIDSKALARQTSMGAAIVAQARALTIMDDVSFARANSLDVSLYEADKGMIEFFKEPKGYANRLHDWICDQERTARAVMAEGRSLLKPKIRGWIEEQEKRQAELQRQLEEQDMERQKEARKATAAILKKEGLKEEAKQVLATPLDPPTVKAPSFIQPDQRPAMPNRYKAEVVNLTAFIDAVIAGKIPRQAVQPDQVFLNKQASAFQGTLESLYPGVKVVKDFTIRRG